MIYFIKKKLIYFNPKMPIYFWYTIKKIELLFICIINIDIIHKNQQNEFNSTI